MRSLKKIKIDLLLEVLADGEWHWGDELVPLKSVGDLQIQFSGPD